MKKEDKPVSCGHSCVVARPTGMATNGPCHCLDGLPRDKRTRVQHALVYYQGQIGHLEHVLDENIDGTVGARVQWISEFAEREFARSPYLSRPPELFIEEGVAELKSEKNVIERFLAMCDESLSPDEHDRALAIVKVLRERRKAL